MTSGLRRARTGRATFALGVACLALAFGACERSPRSEAPAAPTPPTSHASRWKPAGAGLALIVDHAALEEELGAASAAARRTAGEARRRWRTASAAERTMWAVKWAAPVRRGAGKDSVEHVWVLPTSWTADRVEGVLATEPLREIGHRLGDVVGFPASELSDWVRCLDGPPETHLSGRREGGFTLAVLERLGR